MKKFSILLVQLVLFVLIAVIAGESLHASPEPHASHQGGPAQPEVAQPRALGSTMHVESQSNPLTPVTEAGTQASGPATPERSRPPQTAPSLEGSAGLTLEPAGPADGDAIDQMAQECTWLLHNPGFETDTHWYGYPSSHASYNNAVSYAGARSFYMTTYGQTTVWVGQTVQLPADMESIFVRFQYAAWLDPYETAWVEVWSSDGKTRLDWRSIPGATGNWYELPYWLNAEKLAGREVTLWFALYADSDQYYSQMWLDNIELAVCNTEPPPSTDITRTIDLSVSINGTANEATRKAFHDVMYWAALAVYEMSNGKHYLGTVTFYENKVNWYSAHVRWHPGSGRPTGAYNGYWHPGENRFINLYTEYPIAACGNMLVNTQCGGYTLAHELGHYYYGLYDEYEILREDNDVWYSIMSYHYKAVDESDPYRLAWLNFSVPLKDTTGRGWAWPNNQWRAYGKSGWETLVSPYEPYSSYRNSETERRFFEELVSVAPQAGEWPTQELWEEASLADDRLRFYWAPRTLAPAPEATYQAHIATIPADEVAYPTPVLVEASIAGEALIARAGIQAHFTGPDGKQQALSLRDDGIPPDAIADDGRYSGFMPYQQNGRYELTVTFDNAAGNALYTFRGLADALEDFGDPVAENFQASASTAIDVAGVAADDHGDQFESATTLRSDNVPATGRIDRASDADLFKATWVGNGPQIFRISNLGEGIQPRIRFWDAASGTLLGDYTITPEPGYYYYAAFTGEAGAVLMVSISDGDAKAGGSYDVSFGPPVTGELAGGGHTLYMPVLHRPEKE